MSNSPESHGPGGSHTGGPGAASGSGSGSGAKRGARACAACRRGKNRCVPDDSGVDARSCKKCVSAGIQCVFEPPPAKLLDEERMERMEHSLQSLHQTVQALVGLIRHNPTPPQIPSFNPLAGVSFQGLQNNPSIPPPMDYQNPMRLPTSHDFNPNLRPNPYPQVQNTQPWETQAGSGGGMVSAEMDQNGGKTSLQLQGKGKRARDSYPPLPNFRAPPHPISQYGLLPSAAPSDDEDDTLPKSSLTAPFEALAEAAAAAAASGSGSKDGGRGNQRVVDDSEAGRIGSRKRRRRAQIPPNAFPDVIEKGLVSDAMGRHLHALYFQHCNHFFPIHDITYDHFDSIRERSPWTTDSILFIAASRISNPSKEELSIVDNAGEEAQGIARSSLFGPTVRIEGVMGMALLAAWSDNGYLAAGHAIRMGFDLGFHRALGKLVEDEEQNKVRKREEERDLVVSARTLLCLYQLDYLLSNGSGRPHCFDQELVDEVKLAAFLRHPLSIDSDRLLVAQVELVSLRSKMDKNLKGFGTTQNSALDSRVIEYARAASGELKEWWKTWDSRVGEKFSPNSIERSLLLCSLHAATIFLFTSVLKNTSMSDADLATRELASLARAAAASYIEICLSTTDFLRHAMHSTFVEAAFSGLLLLKLSRLFPDFPDGLSLSKVVQVTTTLAGVLEDLPGAQRFGRTIRIALERFAKAFAVELSPKQEDTTLPQMTMESFELHSNATSGLLSNYDLTSLPISDPAWVGTELYPEWLSNDSSWTFGSSDLSQGLDRIFLPLWSQELE